MAAAESLPYLLEAAKGQSAEFVAEMWAFICPELVKAIGMDPDSDVQAEHMWSLAKVRALLSLACRSERLLQCIENLGAGCLTEECMAELAAILNKLLEEHFSREKKREGVRSRKRSSAECAVSR